MSDLTPRERQAVRRTVSRYEGRGVLAVLRVAMDAHRDPERGVFTNREVCRISSRSDELDPVPYDSVAKITRGLVELGVLWWVAGRRPKLYAIARIGARALGRMAVARSRAYG